MIHSTYLVALLLLIPVSMALCRDSGGMYTPEKLANIARNVEAHDWAKGIRDGAVRSAQTWADMSDEDLWNMIPGQDLPRCIDVSMTYTKSGKVRPGCLVCGDEVFKHGNYPYNPNVFGKPWKLTCPSCKSVFPTNDFGKYYRSGIDEHGVFNPEKADRSLLFNAEHPDPEDPLHLWGVDDGFGYIDENGHGHRYIAYYTWKLWGVIRSGLGALSNAYLYSGDPLYARKAAIMLDRIADVYPDMDWNPYATRGWYHSDGGSKRGKIDGAIWETGILKTFAVNYDKIITGLNDQPELYEFLRAKAEQYTLPGPKGTREQLMANIDDRILRCGAEAIRAHRIWGNEGMHQSAMAACAIALDTDPDTSAMLDWVFAPDGGHIPGVIVGGIDRDGVGAEAAPGYALGWGANIGRLADMLADYGKYEAHDIYRDFPQFANTFTAGSRITVLDYDTPSIGDTGSTGSIGKVQVTPSFMIRGYRYLQDPGIALAAWRANSNVSEGLGRSIMDADPDWIAKDIDRIVAEAGASAGSLGPHHMAGYGFLCHEYGHQRNGTGLYLYYGRNGGHGHLDRLNIGIYGFGFDLAPDLGYPEFATSWPKRNEWTDPTLSHNTVVIDEIPQKVNWVGLPRFFKTLPGLQCAEVESPSVYGAAREYRRTIALINVSEWLGYGVDIFRVAGGNDHIRSFHGPGTELETTGLDLAEQESGSYAGPDVPFGTSIPRGPRMGYSWLDHVEYDSLPPAAWTVDWRVPAGYRGAVESDDVHLRMWNFTPADDITLADGEPPQNKSGNPRRLRYCLTHRKGEDLTTTFVSLLEPYRESPLIKSAERIDIPGADPQDGPVALKVELADGPVDYILYSPDGETVTVPGVATFTGRLAFVRTVDGETQRAALIAGTKLDCDGLSLEAPAPAFTGSVVKMDKDTQDDARVWVDAQLPADGTLVGQEMIIANDGARNACYTIEEIERDGDLTMVSFGKTSFVRGYIDRNDYSKGFAYNFEEGAAFSIPNHIFAERRGAHLIDVRTTAGAGLALKDEE